MAKEKKINCAYCKGNIDIPQKEDEQPDESDLIKRGSLRFHKKCFEEYQKLEEKPEIKVRSRTCPECKVKINPLDDDAIDIGVQTLHITCNDKIKRIEINRKDLLDYISLKYNMEFPTGFILKQVGEYHTKRGYSYKGMKMCMVYIIEVEKIPVKEGSGIGLIPHFYERAKIYYKKIALAKSASDNVVIDNTPVKITAIREKTKENNRHYRLEDI